MRPVRTLLFSTLYPSSARPVHGIFVETRLRHLCAQPEIQARVVAPVPWFPSRHAAFGAWASYAATPSHERRGSIAVWHPRYALPPKVGDRWRFNVFRIKRPHGPSEPEREAVYAAWSIPSGPSFHDPAAFRDFVFAEN